MTCSLQRGGPVIFSHLSASYIYQAVVNDFSTNGALKAHGEGRETISVQTKTSWTPEPLKVNLVNCKSDHGKPLLMIFQWPAIALRIKSKFLTWAFKLYVIWSLSLSLILFHTPFLLVCFTPASRLSILWTQPAHSCSRATELVVTSCLGGLLLPLWHGWSQVNCHFLRLDVLNVLNRIAPLVIS